MLVWRHARVPLAAFISIAVLMIASASPASPTSPAEGADGASRLVVVMDSSGSMKEAAAGGHRRIDAAKTALGQVIDSLPADQEVGLRVYGAEVFSRNDPGACEDSQLVVPVAAGNRDRLRAAVRTYQPYGETPTGYALREAGEDLGDEGDRNIVLVSDGEPTCEPDPCVVARQLTADGIALRIDVVGLAVSGEARRTLQCVADAGGGVYYDASSAEELTESLVRVAERSARGYQEVGAPVVGAPAPDDAPVIGAGDWVDVVEASQPERHYLVRRELENSTLHVSTAFRSPREDDVSFNRLRLETPEGETCGTGGEVEQLASGVLLATAAVSGPFDTFGDPAPDHPCQTARELVAVVDYQGDSAGTPIELRVTELPAVVDPASLPPAVEDVTWSAPTGGGRERTEVSGGTSFVDQEPLSPGSYRGTIVPGETLMFSTDVEWGQQLDVAATVEAAEGPLQPATAGSPMAVLELYNPARGAAGSTDTDETLFEKGALSHLNPQVLGQSTGPVTFANMTSSYYEGSSLPGTYTIALALEDTEENASLPIPFELDVAVVGDPVPGPEFDERPYEDAAEASESPSTGATDDGDQPRAAAGTEDSGSPVLTWVLAALGLTAVWIGAGILLRRKSPADADA